MLRLRRFPWAHTLVCSVLAVVGCTKPPAIAPPEAPVVTVENPRQQTWDNVKEFTGYLKAVESQEVRAQVTGYLKEVKYKEGEYVKEGDPLFEIEPESYEATLQNAKASLKRAEFDADTAKANLALAKTEFDRAEQSAVAISREEFDKRKNALQTATIALNTVQSNIEIAKSNVRKADFDRKNCTIRSDVKGTARTSRALITKGNLVIAGQTILCTVTSVNPIHAFWDVDETTSLEYRRKVYDTKEIPNPRDERKLKCWIGLKDETRDATGKWPHRGTVDYIAPEIVRGTGAREIRAILDNDNGRLSPGDSVRVQVEAGAARQLIVIPEVAISSQQQQKMVFVVAKDKDGKTVAEIRPVELGETREINGVRLQVVLKGLATSDQVIVNGLLRVRPGAEINPKLQTPLGDSSK